MSLTQNAGWEFIKELINDEIQSFNSQKFKSTRPEDIAVEALSRQSAAELLKSIISRVELLNIKKEDIAIRKRMI